MADDYFKRGQADVLDRLNSIKTLLQTSGSAVNPVFQSFGGVWSIPDRRGAGVVTPGQYVSKSATFEFNSVENLGSPQASPYWGYVLTVSGWMSDGSGGGGFPVQLNFGDGLAYRRGASASAWNGWKRICSYDDVMPAFSAGLSVNCGDGQSFRLTQTSRGAEASVAIGTYSDTKNAAIAVTAHGNEYVPYGVFRANTAGLYTGCGTMSFLSDSSGEFVFGNPNELVRIDKYGNIKPGTDNAQTLGDVNRRLSVLYCATGTINTSDAREKTSLSGFSAAEKLAAKQLLREISKYQWLEAIEKKGQDMARWHVGMTVQRAIEILQENGLNPMSYAFICYDEWPDEYEEVDASESDADAYSVPISVQSKVIKPITKKEIEIFDGSPVLRVKEIEIEEPLTEMREVLNEVGEVVRNANGVALLHPVPVFETRNVWRKKVLKRKAGGRYGFRYDQLAMFILAGLMID